MLFAYLSLVLAVIACLVAAKAISEKSELEYITQKLDERIHDLELYYEEVEEIKERLKDAPIEKLDEIARQEEAYYQGLQNIFNYGGAIARLNVEALENE